MGSPAPADEPMTTPADPSASMTSPDAVTLSVEVPADARVFVNGLATKSTGTMRRYVSRGLERGFTYSYEIRAEIERDGQTYTDTKNVRLEGGQTARLAMSFDAMDRANVARTGEPLRTTLLLKVPADAKVFLAGNPTTSEGEVREFSTTRLADGGEWASYPIRVEVTIDGQSLTQERTVALKAGETKEVSFDFNSSEVAQASR